VDMEKVARREGFDDGVQLGAKVEHDAAVAALADALLRVLGKDRGDGYIDLGAAGRWYPGADNGRAEKVDLHYHARTCAHADLDPGDRCSICQQVQ